MSPWGTTVADDDPPVISRSPRGTVVFRLKRRTQVAVAKVAAPWLLKLIVGLVAAGAAGVAAWRC